MTIFVKTLKGTYSEIEENPEDTGIPEQAEVPPVARAHATNPPAQPALPAQPAPVPSSGPNANPLDPSPQGLPDMGSDAAGGGNLDFLSNSLEANPQLLWYIRNLLWQLAVIVTPEDREAIERAPQACAAPLTSTPVSAAPQPSATTLAPPASVPAPAPASSVTDPSSDVYGQAASNLVAGNNHEGAIQQILDLGGGTWDRDTVVRALCAAFYDRERAVEYLNSGIPEQAEVPPVARAHATNPPAQPALPAQPAPVPSSGPNANPLDPSPQGLPDMGSNAAGGGNLDFLSNSPEANPQLLWIIKNLLLQLAPGMLKAITVTPEEREAIERASAAPPTSTPVSAAPQPSATTLAPPASVPAPAPAAAPASSVTDPSSDVYGQATSNLVAMSLTIVMAYSIVFALLGSTFVKYGKILLPEIFVQHRTSYVMCLILVMVVFFFAVNGITFSEQSPRIGRACKLVALIGVILLFTLLLLVLFPPIFWAAWAFFAFTSAALIYQFFFPL